MIFTPKKALGTSKRTGGPNVLQGVMQRPSGHFLLDVSLRVALYYGKPPSALLDVRSDGRQSCQFAVNAEAAWTRTGAMAQERDHRIISFELGNNAARAQDAHGSALPFSATAFAAHMMPPPRRISSPRPATCNTE